jgi:hypothetical protein
MSTARDPLTPTDLALKRHVQSIFDVSIQAEKRNVDTTHWFGVKEKTDDGSKTFLLHSTGRLPALLGTLDKPDEHFPSLISFVSCSSSEKSTLIRALMLQQKTNSPKILPIPSSFMHLGKATTEAVEYQLSLCKILPSNCSGRYICTRTPRRSTTIADIQFSLQTVEDSLEALTIQS